ncbi:hypothetical protein SAMN05428949_3183 [Chitinophaga sp. YR627]|jgi:hypothetical protein|uniref:hypothetical protein n=1 Tax=Chitinophaga TaxID=79328 RepID=UPI0008E4AFCF|nr:MULTISPECIES: hypothetical protein [Chitinophaga]SFN69846.1 hypothetical protein SAMN05428949_3183 [Chitinophaga sp. YR627]
MKKLLFLMAVCGIFAIGCKTERTGCPNNNYYSAKNGKQNRSSIKQMNGRVF